VAEKTRPVPSRSVEDVRAALVVAAAKGDTQEIRGLLGELERLDGVARRLRLVTGSNQEAPAPLSTRPGAWLDDGEQQES
jgi:hypothetical protein